MAASGDAVSLTKMSFEELKSIDQKYWLHGLHHPKKQQDPIMFVEGKGAMLRDKNGNEYVDANAALYTAMIGHGRQEMADAAAAQLRTLQFTPSLAGYSNPAAALLAKKIVTLANDEGLTNMSQVFFCDAGAESNETAFNIALRYWEMKNMKSKCKFISFKNCYHGASFMCASVNPAKTSTYGWERLTHSTITGTVYDQLHKPFTAIDFPNANFFPHDKIREGESLGQAAARLLEERIIAEGVNHVCAFIFEPIQGDGGSVIPHPDFFPLARKICDKYGVLMIDDEVLTFGKTGKYFALNHWNVKPDIVTVAKTITSGYSPLGAVMISQDVRKVAFENVPEDKEWKHDFTYTGHSTCCAVALKNLEIYEKENLVKACETKGLSLLTALTDRLSKFTNAVQEVRGQGLLITVHLKGDWAEEVEHKMAREQKVLPATGANSKVINICPPAVITEEQMARIVTAFENVLSEFNKPKPA